MRSYKLPNMTLCETLDLAYYCLSMDNEDRRFTGLAILDTLRAHLREIERDHAEDDAKYMDIRPEDPVSLRPRDRMIETGEES